MRWATTAFLLLCPAFGAGAAHAQGPVCLERSVVEEISREIRLRDYYARVDPQLVAEFPTGDPAIVVCQVCVLLAPYDSSRLGTNPIGRCQPRNFDVRIVTNGFIVSHRR